MSKKIIELKAKQTTDCIEKIKKAKSFLIFEYFGLDVKKMTKMRTKMHEKKASIAIIKNNILNRALHEVKIENIPEMVGPNAIMFCNDDEIIGFKTIYDAIKNNKTVKYKFGYLENKIITNEQLPTIAAIPNRDGLYSMVLSCLLAPIKKLLYGLKAIKK